MHKMKTLFISRNILNYRIQNEITQREFADMLGVSPQAVSKWEKEHCYPDIFTLPDLAKIMHITVDELLGEDVYSGSG